MSISFDTNEKNVVISDLHFDVRRYFGQKRSKIPTPLVKVPGWVDFSFLDFMDACLNIKFSSSGIQNLTCVLFWFRVYRCARHPKYP